MTDGSERSTVASGVCGAVTAMANGPASGVTMPPPRLPCWTTLRLAGVGSKRREVASAGRVRSGVRPAWAPAGNGRAIFGHVPDRPRLMSARCPAGTITTTVRRAVVATRTPATSAPSIARAAGAGSSSSTSNDVVTVPSEATPLVPPVAILTVPGREARLAM